MKIYTGTGDKGRTGLFSGERVPKHHLRVEAYGELDELNSALGVLASQLPDSLPDLHEEIRRIQSDLFLAGSWLAVSPGSEAAGFLDKFEESAAAYLETAIDRMDAQLEPLTGFILPGGNAAAAWAHYVRTVCRRAERRITAAAAEGPAGNPNSLGGIIVFINRLSDYLFMLARYFNHLEGRADIPWRR